MTGIRSRWAASRVATAAALVLLIAYAATLAPDVTFWDAGEFIAATHALGIPHPPGTPLFVLLLNTWARLLAFLPYAVRTNLFSAVCTAGAAALTAIFVLRATRDPWSAFAGAITAGAMSSVWSNATETEVYAASLALAFTTLVAADRAGRECSPRWRALTAYLIALSVPLHLSALVAAPVAIYLSSATPAADRRDGWRVDLSWALALTGLSLLTMALGVVSERLAIAGGLVLLASIIATRIIVPARGFARPTLRAAMLIALLAVAGSALLFMLVRARFDPAINQGNPSTLSRLADVIGRRQYAVQPVWPRQAPLWLQIANWFDYADWQVALSLGPGVIPTPSRVLATVLFALLAVVGAAAHRHRDRRTFYAVLLLLGCGSLGVVLYLNLKAGPSFGWGVLPEGALREARERDYFFVLGFWAWGIWAGMGAIAVARRFGGPAPGVAIAAAPLILNWATVNRRDEPEASMPRMLAQALLAPAPPQAVLFVAGDNDTYPLWYMQQVYQLRRDVTVVTTPLLNAEWYAAELSRRERLLAGGYSAGEEALETKIAQGARRLGRPVVVALTVPDSDRNRLGGSWTVVGLDAIERTTIGNHSHAVSAVNVAVDTASTRSWAMVIGHWSGGRRPRESVDPVHAYFGSVLECPGWIADSNPSPRRTISLDSLCNLR